MNASHPIVRQKTNQNIQVYVRLRWGGVFFLFEFFVLLTFLLLSRPTNVREKTIKSLEIVEVASCKEVLVRQPLDTKTTKKFTFDRTFGPDSKQVCFF